MKISTVGRGLIIGLVLIMVSLIGLSTHAWMGSASSIPQDISESSLAVIQSRDALDRAIAFEQTHPGPDSVRATTEAFRSYKIAVENRSAEIRTTQADIERDVSGARAAQARLNSLENEYNELQKSLSSYYEKLRATHPSLEFQISPAVPGTVFTGGAITINASASPPTAASPYPSTINVSGLTGTINKVTVTLTNFSTTFPDNIDMLLVGPTGVNGIIMSDAGGNSCANCPVTLVLDDTAASPLPNNGPPLDVGLSSGTFQSSNWNSGDVFASPAPAPTNNTQSFGTALAGFNGTDPNGTWSLYVVHDGTSITGTIDSWSLDIDSGAGPCSITCPTNVTVAKNANFCGAVVTYPDPTTTGACGAIVCSPPSGSYFPVGTTTVTCTEQVTSGATCSFTVTVMGACGAGEGCNNVPITINTGGTPPTVATPYPSDIGISGLTGQVVSKVTVTLANFSHDFPDDVDILLVGPGGQEATIMSDVGGNNAISSSAPITLTLDDAAALSLPDSTTLSTGTFKPTNIQPGGVGDTFPSPAPTPSGGSALSVFNGTDPNGTWSLYVVDDGAAFSGQLAAGWCITITTTTPTPCMLTCPTDVTQAKDANFCGAIVTYPAPTTTGTCGTIVCSPPSGSYFPVGTTTVTCSDSGTSGQTCTFTVTVTGTCPDGQICNNTSITINTGSPPTAATPYPSDIAVSGLAGVVGKVTVTLANFSHDFPDDVDILLVGPGGQEATIMSDVGGNNAISSGAPITLTLDDAAASSLPDSTMLSSGTFKPTNIQPGGVGDTFPSPAPTPSGASALSVFNGTDPNGTWSLYVVDDGAASAGLISGGWCLNITLVCGITCPADITVGNDTGQCGAVVTFAPTTTGPCGTITCTPPSGSFFPVGTTTVTCANAGGTPSCSFTITVNDTEAPVVTCPADITTGNDTGQCSAVVNFMVTANDNCDGAITPVCTPPSGSTFPVGTTTVTCTAMDTASNSGSCSFTVTVNDTELPTITCPSPITTSNDTGQCSAVVTFADPTVSDNCPGVGTPTCNPPSGTAFPVGTTTVTCSVQDAAGNTGNCSFTVTVNETEPPTITCPAPIMVNNDPNQCGAVVNFTPTVTDNCPGATATCKPASGSFFPIGVTTVSCTPVDAAGNTGTPCSFTVTVVDNQPPVVTCPAPITVNNAPDQCGATVNYVVTVTDNCPGATVVCVPASGSFFPVGTTTVNCMGMDAAGNTATCSFTVTVLDVQPPTIICPDDILITTVNPGDPRVVVNYPPPVTADNCGVASVVCNPPSGSEFPLGSTTVVCTVTDTSGNTATCSFTVTVFDVCLQDQTNGNFIVFNSQTGDYLFVRCSDGFQISGRGTITRPNGCTITLTHNLGTQFVNATVNTCTHKGSATYTVVVKNRLTVSSINDPDTTNSTCSCPTTAPSGSNL